MSHKSEGSKWKIPWKTADIPGENDKMMKKERKEAYLYLACESLQINFKVHLSGLNIGFTQQTLCPSATSPLPPAPLCRSLLSQWGTDTELVDLWSLCNWWFPQMQQWLQPHSTASGRTGPGMEAHT